MAIGERLRAWCGKYGGEAAFVGRVAVAAFLPPGAGALIEKGLEAAFEYIQSQPERTVDPNALNRHLAEAGISNAQSDELSELIERVAVGGEVTLERAYAARQAGSGREEIERGLRELITSDPALSALRASLEQIGAALTRLGQQGEVLIAGQAYQTEAIEEMMRMIHSIAAQVGANVTPPPQLPSQLSSQAAPPLLSAPSASEQLSAAFGLSNNSPSAPAGNSSALDSLSARPSAPASGSSALDSLSARPSAAGDLVVRFYETTRTQPHVQKSEAVNLVERFQALTKARGAKGTPRLDALSASQPAPSELCAQVGEGRVALSLEQAGPQPIGVVKWLCEAWGYSLPDAIIATQSAPVVVRRSNDFVSLGRAQADLQRLGATLKLIM